MHRPPADSGCLRAATWDGRLELDQLFEQQVVGPIVNLCRIEHMVEVVVTIELVHQLVHACRRLHLVRSGFAAE